MMSKIYVRARSPEDWRPSLANPKKHWESEHSAWAMAHCWQTARGFPPEIERLFKSCDCPALQIVRMLLAIPEYQVTLPPHPGHASQSDLFVLGKAADENLVSITVEGKVDEGFDKTLEQWKKTPGKEKRWISLKELLNLSHEPPAHLRYQLFHRLASAIIEGRKFNARYAVMIVHSFSSREEGFGDFSDFVSLFGARAVVGRLEHLTELGNLSVFTG
jgi:hypothetical protein